MKKNLLRIGLALVAFCVMSLSGIAMAGNATSVSINEQNGDFWGRVNSPRVQCEEGRKVLLLKVKPGKDERVGMDTSGNNGDWNTGNTGFNSGRYYAKATRTSNCDSAKSQTVRV